MSIDLPSSRLYVFAQVANSKELSYPITCSRHRTVDSSTSELHRSELRLLVRLNYECFPSFITLLLPQSPHFIQDLSSFVCQGGVQLTATRGGGNRTHVAFPTPILGPITKSDTWYFALSGLCQNQLLLTNLHTSQVDWCR